MACLAALCVVLPGRVSIAQTELRWPTLADVFGDGEPDPMEFLDSLESLEPIESLPPTEPTQTTKTTQPTQPTEPTLTTKTTEPTLTSKTTKTTEPTLTTQTTKTTEPTEPVVPTDPRIFLRCFYASLEDAGEHKIRVLHYGDSQIEEDRMTQQIREALQKRYGGQGVGLMPLAQTIPTRTVRQEIRMNGRIVPPKQGPKRYLVYGPKREQRKDNLYGIMGQVAVMNDSLVSGSEDLTAVCRPQMATAHYQRWQIFADSTIRYSISGDTVQLRGKGAVYALSQESDTGVIVDNIPMRGCLGNVFTRMDSAQLASFCRAENVRLIILQFGGNAIPFNEKPQTIRGFVSGYREQIHYLRACAPEADILFIGPSDMIRQKDGEWQTYPMVPYMDKLLRNMAMDEQIAYFSLFNWMGGAGSMLRWQENGLAGSDGVHFYRSGARKAGNAVAEWILSATY